MMVEHNILQILNRTPIIWCRAFYLDEGNMRLNMTSYYEKHGAWHSTYSMMYDV